MRWHRRDWVLGLVAVVIGIPVWLPGIVWDLSILRPGTPRVWVERCLGEPYHTTDGSYCISIRATDDEREQMREAIHTELCRYSPLFLYTIKVEYSGYRYQRLTSVSFHPGWGWMRFVSWFTLSLLFAATAELSRFLRRQFTAPLSTAPSP